jgi:hypothetical protein
MSGRRTAWLATRWTPDGLSRENMDVYRVTILCILKPGMEDVNPLSLTSIKAREPTFSENGRSIERYLT